jgi:hypothetical protein
VPELRLDERVQLSRTALTDEEGTIMQPITIRELDFHDVSERPEQGEHPSPLFLVAFAELGSAQTDYDWRNDCWPKSLPGRVVKWARMNG